MAAACAVGQLGLDRGMDSVGEAVGCVYGQVRVEGERMLLIARTSVCLCKRPTPRGQTRRHFTNPCSGRLSCRGKWSWAFCGKGHSGGPGAPRP